MDKHEWIRLGIFAGVFILFAILEALRPRRRRSMTRWIRWVSNLGLVTMNTILVPLVVPVMGIGVALIAHDRGWGLFNLWELPLWLTLPLSVVILDFVVYGQHVMFHAIPMLWRLHRVHHSDVDLDASSGIRFHFIEILISMGIKMMAITILGAPVIAVLVFEVLLNATSMFNHANLRLPIGVDRIVRLFLVTPDMHRVHHSVDWAESNSNFGFNLPWWDYLCRTYKAQPAAGHEDMKIGVEAFREPREQCIDQLLLQPFKTIDVDRTGAPDKGSIGIRLRKTP